MRKARDDGFYHEWLVYHECRLTGPEPVRVLHGHGHDPVARKAVRRLEADTHAPLSVRDQPIAPDGGGHEVLPKVGWHRPVRALLGIPNDDTFIAAVALGHV